MSVDYNRSSFKRKLDDYGPSTEEFDLLNESVRMRKDDDEPFATVKTTQTTNPHDNHHHQPPSSSQWAPSPSRSHHIAPPPPNQLQFFVRTMPCSSSTGHQVHSTTIVLRANSDDTIASVHDTIRQITRVPVDDQWLLYEGKQLQREQTLAECSVRNDAGLILLGRMRGTRYPMARRLVDDLIISVLRLCKVEEENDSQTVSSKLLSNKVNAFFSEVTDKDHEDKNDSKFIDPVPIALHLQVFMTSHAPSALVMLYLSPFKGNKQLGDESIRRVVGWGTNVLRKCLRFLFVPIVLEFCKLMMDRGGNIRGDPLYCFCRNSLASMMDCVRLTSGSSKRSVAGDGNKGLVCFQDVYLFVSEIMDRLCTDLGTSVGPSSSDVGDLTAFLGPLCKLSSFCAAEIKSLQILFDALMGSLEQCLEKLEESLAVKEKKEGEHLPLGCAHYLTILKDMNNLVIARLYCGAQDKLVRILKRRKVAVCHLVIKYATCSDDHRWLLKHNGVTDFECRRHFAMLLVDELIYLVLRLHMCKEEKDSHTGSSKLLSKSLSDKLIEFLGEITDKDKDKNKNDSKLIAADPTDGHLQVFMTSRAPSFLVMLYMSPSMGNKQLGDDLIRRVVGWGTNVLRKCLRFLCVPIVLEFCKLMMNRGGNICGDPLYCFCRNSLASMMDCVSLIYGSSKQSVSGDSSKALVLFQDVYQFVLEIMDRLCTDLGTSVGPSSSDVGALTAFLGPLCTAIVEHRGSVGSISLQMCQDDNNLSCYDAEIKSLKMFDALMGSLEQCLEKLEESLAVKEKREGEHLPLGCAHYLTILKDMDNLARLYCGAQDKLVWILKSRKVAVCHLVMKYATRSDDHRWLLKHNGVTDFECRRHFAMMMLPEAKEGYEELHEMLVDRSQLLAESFEYFLHAGPETLRAGLFMEFENEEATGPGVLREWFCLVCQAIFNPQNALFLACPSDRRRFFPNPASKVNPLHLKYFKFAGRVIALALMHKVQVGIVFDRIFFLQLAGKNVSLEDIHDADPCLYSGCKKILEMDAEVVDSGALGLTFVLDVEELGSRRIVELCPGGKNIVVNSRNREAYVKCLIEHRFVTSITEHVAWFAQGFSDILCDSKVHKCFFQSLELEDLDWMLHGSENAISVEDWKAHTEYKGYKETDPQILWFWQIVGQMSADRRKVLLFFWTSVKYLPVEGFGGLASRLYIHKASESYNRLPSSHTCFYQLCFAPYPSLAVMENRLHIITQEHVGSSFGTW